jgi:hypothetical protein
MMVQGYAEKIEQASLPLHRLEVFPQFGNSFLELLPLVYSYKLCSYPYLTI